MNLQTYFARKKANDRNIGTAGQTLAYAFIMFELALILKTFLLNMVITTVFLMKLTSRPKKLSG